MPHLHTKPGEHDHTASGYIVRGDQSEPRLLLHMHKKLGKYFQFGGHIETTETPWQAVAREILEESGYEMSQLQILQPADRLERVTGAVLHPIPMYHQTHSLKTKDIHKMHFHIDVAYPFIASGEPAHPVGENESNHLRWFTRSELINLSSDEIFESVREAGLYILDVCLPKWEKINTSAFK